MEEFEILLNGDIDWEINAWDVRRMLADANGKNLNIKISSDGGSVKEATIIRNDIISYMKKFNADVNFEVVGWVQSAASYLTTIKGATVSVNPDSLYMYHNPSSVIWGDYVAMEDQSIFLKALAETYATGYAAKSGTDREEILTGMKSETFLIGQEIIDNGFADELVESDSNEDDDTNMKSRDNLIVMSKDRYTATNNRLVAAAMGKEDPKAQNNKPEPSAPKKEDVTMSKTNEEKEEKGAKPVVVDDKDRAFACMRAQKALPKEHDALMKAFEAGQPSAYFDGVLAHVDMLKSSEDGEKAKEESTPEIDPKEPELKPEMKKTAGRSGQTVEVK